MRRAGESVRGASEVVRLTARKTKNGRHPNFSSEREPSGVRPLIVAFPFPRARLMPTDARNTEWEGTCRSLTMSATSSGSLQ